ncbi:MAG TPA: guanylate kinase [Thermoanaerobacterales bacterium]|nr:guanylate kinase [Thermoanaerobacterales bacterium]
MKHQGMLIVVSGPSGAGKGTLCNLLLKRDKNLTLSVSVTTRLPREGEKEGINYFFTSVDDFQKRIKNNEFLEWAMVYNNYYGTPREFVEKQMNDGRDVILEIDIQGAAQVKKNYPEAVFIFILPPDLEELKNRIVKRGSETADSVNLRMKSAREELKAIFMYDYTVINDNLENALLAMQSIVCAERCRVSRNKDLLEFINGREENI